MQSNRRPIPPGIEVRHRRGCSFFEDPEACSCKPGYRAEVYIARAGRKKRRTFQTIAAAKAWRSDAQSALRNGLLATARSVRFADFVETFLAGAAEGVIRDRSGERYKPSTIKGYAEAFNLRLIPALGQRQLDAVARPDLQLVI